MTPNLTLINWFPLLSQSQQETLNSLTSETVRKLSESQQDLLSSQHSLRDAHDDIFKHIAVNVKEIMQEKALIASGNQELAQLTENIREKLGLFSMELKACFGLKDLVQGTEFSVYFVIFRKSYPCA